MTSHFLVAVAGIATGIIMTAPIIKARPMPFVAAGPHIAALGPTDPPTAFLDFCARHPEQCTPKLGQTTDDLSYLDIVNKMVNAEIRPATDQEVHGKDEFWTLPDSAGDCEDLALLKRKLLIDLGWPSRALLITVVQKPSGEGHAVLMVRTSFGDLILDSIAGEIHVWHHTNYTFVMRQSELHPKEWVELAGVLP